MASSPLSTTSVSSSARPRGEPTVTPGRFGRFFTPRSTSSESSRSLFSNRSTPSDGSVSPVGHDVSTAECRNDGSKIETVLDHDANGAYGISSVAGTKRKFGAADWISPALIEEMMRRCPKEPIHRSRARERLGGSLCRELGWASHGLNRSTDNYRPEFERRAGFDTFYTCDRDVNWMQSMKGDQFVEGKDKGRVFPFCSAACYNDPLVAVGDDDGYIRLLDSSAKNDKGFDQEILDFSAHRNTILDLAFSFDDLQLASAGGDNICRIWDVKTQRDVYALSGHTDSLKRVLWQPGSANNRVLVTSSRDYTVKIWDTRVRGTEIHTFSDGVRPLHEGLSPPKTTTKIDVINTMSNLNGFTLVHKGIRLGSPPACQTDDHTTCMAFLPFAPHMLITGAAQQSGIRMWDIRRLQGDKGSKPVAMVQPSSSETPGKGTVALAVNTNGTRLFALDRAASLRAYSTQHFFQGSGLDVNSERSSRTWAERKPVRPIWQCQVKRDGALVSYHTRLACRPATSEQTELLAMGSDLNGAIVMNTDERVHANHYPRQPRVRPRIDYHTDMQGDYRDTYCDPHPLKKFSIDHEPLTVEDDLECRYCESMIRNCPSSQFLHGHEKEVSSVTWTSEGNLITCGDDMNVRVWRPYKRDTDRSDPDEGLDADSDDDVEDISMTACQLHEINSHFEPVAE